MASNIKFDFKDIKPDIDTVRDLAYKSDYNFEQIITALSAFSYRGVEIGPNEPEDKECLWIDTKDETVEESAQNIAIIQDLVTAIRELNDRMTTIEQAIASGGGVLPGEGEVTQYNFITEDGSPLVTELGVPFLLESAVVNNNNNNNTGTDAEYLLMEDNSPRMTESGELFITENSR